MLASIPQPTVLSFQQYYGFKTLAMAFIARVLLAFVLAAVTANAAVDKAQGVAIGHSKDAAQACFGDATPFPLPVSHSPARNTECRVLTSRLVGRPRQDCQLLYRSMVRHLVRPKRSNWRGEAVLIPYATTTNGVLSAALLAKAGLATRPPS